MESTQDSYRRLEERVNSPEEDLFANVRCVYCHDDFACEPSALLSVMKDIPGAYLHEDCGDKSKLKVKKLGTSWQQVRDVFQESYKEDPKLSPQKLYARIEEKFAPKKEKQTLDAIIFEGIALHTLGTLKYLSYAIDWPFFVGDKLYEKGMLKYPGYCALVFYVGVGAAVAWHDMPVPHPLVRIILGAMIGMNMALIGAVCHDFKLVAAGENYREIGEMIKRTYLLRL